MELRLGNMYANRSFAKVLSAVSHPKSKAVQKLDDAAVFKSNPLAQPSSKQCLAQPLVPCGMG